MKALSISAAIIFLTLTSCGPDPAAEKVERDTSAVDTAAVQVGREPAPARDKLAHVIENRDTLAMLLGDKGVDWGKPSRGLRLGLGVRKGMVELLHHNVDTLPLRLMLADLHADGSPDTYPHHGLMLRDENGVDRRLGMLGICAECSVLAAELKPGAITKLVIDPNDPAWHADGAPSPGTFELTARYVVNTSREGYWRGRTGAGPVSYQVRKPKGKK